MKRKIIISILVVLAFALTGCSFGNGNTENVDSTEVSEQESGGILYSNSWEETREELTNGQVYVLSGKTLKEIYIGNGTFEVGTTSSRADDYRILWFKEDFNKIPTLYKGDSLVFYSTEVFDEEFIFERFEDFGYTLGICKMEETESGRFSIATDYDTCTTYPYSDIDEAVHEHELKYVVLDTLGGAPLTKDQVSRCGSIIGLEKDKVYNAELYAGTILHEVNLKCDVRLLGSMEVFNSTDYTYLSSYIIKLNIPEHFNSGYYCVNGLGVFRYINQPKKNYVSTHEKIDFINGDTLEFNVPNPVLTDEELNANDDRTGQTIETVDGKRNEVVKVNYLGEVLVKLELSDEDGNPIDASKYNVTLTSPSGETWRLVSYESTLFQEITSTEIGEYILGFEVEPTYSYKVTVKAIE